MPKWSSIKIPQINIASSDVWIECLFPHIHVKKVFEIFESDEWKLLSQSSFKLHFILVRRVTWFHESFGFLLVWIICSIPLPILFETRMLNLFYAFVALYILTSSVSDMTSYILKHFLFIFGPRFWWDKPLRLFIYLFFYTAVLSIFSFKASGYCVLFRKAFPIQDNNFKVYNMV